MEKKLLICGSTIAVAVLVLASLSPVVGYNSVKSSVKESPLFAVRTKRAIDAEQDSLTCDYVGKEKGIDILFPTRDSNAVLFQRLIDEISRMNDVDFNRFKGLFINHLKRENTIKDENIHDVVDVLQKIRTNPDEIRNYFTDVKNNNLTFFGPCTTDTQWHPGCIIYFIAVILYGLIAISITLIIIVVYTVIHSEEPSWCHAATCFCI